MTAPDLVWRAAGSPPAKWPLEPASGLCATCGLAITEGVSHQRINQESFSQQGDFFQYGSHVCAGCAWLYTDAHSKHRSLLVVGDTLEWPLLSVDAAAESGRPSWLEALRRLDGLPPDTPQAGVLTTDPKPRFWPRMREGTAATPVLYVHAPDYDLSGRVRVPVSRLLLVADLVLAALALGFTKRTILHSLYHDYRRMLAAGPQAIAVEGALAEWRADPAFVPALLIAGLRKEERDHARSRVSGVQSLPARATGGGARPAGDQQLQLL